MGAVAKRNVLLVQSFSDTQYGRVPTIHFPPTNNRSSLVTHNEIATQIPRCYIWSFSLYVRPIFSFLIIPSLPPPSGRHSNRFPNNNQTRPSPSTPNACEQRRECGSSGTPKISSSSSPTGGEEAGEEEDCNAALPNQQQVVVRIEISYGGLERPKRRFGLGSTLT